MAIDEMPVGPIVEDEEPPRRARRGGVLRVVAFACLMVAFGFGGYVGWLLWGTGLQTSRAQEVLRTEFEEAVSRPMTSNARPLPGDAYARLLIPTIDVNYIVVQGTGYEDLKEGPGHYTDTADPWDGTGRVGIAGHRTTYLAPFLNLDRLDEGDRIVLRTARGTFSYDVTSVDVIPSAGSGKVLTQTKQPTLVLTTCNPKYSAEQRLIVTADLVGTPSS